MNRVDVYAQRMLDASSTFYGYSADVDVEVGKGLDGHGAGPIRGIRSGKRPTSRSRCGPVGRHRELPDRAGSHRVRRKLHRPPGRAGGTPYLPNAIFTTNRIVRPDDYGIPITAQHHDDKTIRNIKLSWQEIKRHRNPLWEKGYQFYCVTPKTRHRVHSQWSVNDWVQIYESNFGDPYRMDKRTPGVGEHQMHINPQAAKDRGINDGDYVYIDGNPVDRPYRGWKPSDPY